MDEREVKGETVGLKNDGLKIKEEITNFGNNVEISNALQEDEISIALSYGEVFIIESRQGSPLTWWICCNICQERFISCENFLDHVTSIHFNKQTNEIFNDEEICGAQSTSDVANFKADKDLSENTNSDSTESVIGRNLKDEAVKIKNKERIIKAKSKLIVDLNLDLKKLKTNVDRNADRHPCPHCDKTFATKERQKYHIASHLGLNRLFKCEECGAYLKSNSTLKSHLRIHTGERPFKCNLCSKAFRARPGLINHMIVHTGNKKFPCSFCGKCFQTRAHKERHEVVHTGERPFQCDECGDTFQTKSSLTEHNKRHKNLRPFTCDICEKSFFNNQQLLLHNVVHTNEKSFICKVCSASFGTKKNLRSHERIHAKSKDYQCKICDESFQTYAAINYHIRKKHEFAPLSYNYTPIGPVGRK